MSLILDALKRLEAKAPPKPPVVDVQAAEKAQAPSDLAVEEALLPTEAPLAAILDVQEPIPAASPKPIVMEGVEITFPDPAAGQWLEPIDLCAAGPEYAEHDLDVQISIAALEGDVVNLDLEIARLAAESESVELVQETPIEPPGDRVTESPTDDVHVELVDLAERHAPTPVEAETTDFAAELARLWDEPADPKATEPPAPAEVTVEEERLEQAVAEKAAEIELPPLEATSQEDSLVTFGPLDDQKLELSVEPLASVPEDAAVEADEPHIAPFDEVEVVEEEPAPQETIAEQDAAETSADVDVPVGAILPIADFRAEPAPEQHAELADDHDVLSAQLTELEFRGLRDNVLSQLPDAPVALLFAAADDETDVADVVLRLSDALAQLRDGDVAVVCSQRLRDAYRASPDYGDLHQVSGRPAARSRRVPTLLIDAADAGDRLVDDLKRRGRFVLFAADGTTARRWSPLCDATYVVVALGNSDRRSAVKSVMALQLAGGHVLGCVLTDVPDVA